MYKKNFKDNKTIIEWECWSRFFPRFILLLYIWLFDYNLGHKKKNRGKREYIVYDGGKKKIQFEQIKVIWEYHHPKHSKKHKQTKNNKCCYLFLVHFHKNKNKLKSKLFHMERNWEQQVFRIYIEFWCWCWSLFEYKKQKNRQKKFVNLDLCFVYIMVNIFNRIRLFLEGINITN